MKKLIILLFAVAALASNGLAATVNWAAGIDNGFSLADGTNVPAGSLVRIGYFRNASTSVQLTDAQIQALASSPATLDASFAEVGSTTIGSGYTSGYAGHFSKATNADTGSSGLNVAGKQIYVWVFNAGTLAGATQHGIYYWLNTNTATNPDSTPETPGARWSFPVQDPPGVTTIDLTDLTTGTSTLAAGAHVVVGAFPTGTSSTTSAPNFGLALISTTLAVSSASPLAGGTVGSAYSQALAAIGGTTPYAWSVSAGTLPTGLTLSSAGVLSGTPGAAGAFNFTAQVTDAASATATKSFDVTITTAPSITTATPLTNGTVGTAYSQTFAVSGGASPYSWAISSGTVPAGLSLSTAGVLSGTPTAYGASSFTVQVTDSVSAIATKVFALTVDPAPLSITTASPLTGGTIGAAYSVTLAASGGTGGYGWTLSAGSLPTGVTLSAAGVVGGTPTVTGTFNFTAQVTDSATTSTTKAFALTIAAAPLSITTASPLTGGEATLAYSQTLAASGGTPGYSWSVSTGTVPTGTTLSAAGVLSGTPTAAGTFNFTALVTDSASATASKAFAVTIVAAPSITTTSPLTAGTISTAYSLTFAGTGGTTAYAWSLTSGTLPAGLSLTTAGVLSGTPTTAGTSTFTVLLTDALGATASLPCSLTVSASGPLHHFTWDYVPAAANVNAPFAARLTARDAAGLLVTSFSGTVNLTAASGSGSVASAIVITEMTDEGEDQFEIQNISNATVNTTGWFVRIGDTQTNSVAGMNTLHATTFALPASMTAGQVIRVTETSANANGTSILYFGATIGWSSLSGNGRGWVMLLDSTSAIKDFFAAGWDATTLASFSVTINSQVKTLTGQWSGAGGVVGSRGLNADMPGVTLDSFQRTGTGDNNTSADWVWRNNGAGATTSAMSFGTTNTGLTVPWVTTTPVTMTPTSVTLTNGEFTGYLTVTQVANTVSLTATSAAITGVSATFNVTAALTDTDGDGIPDAWETAHGSNPALADSSLDSDGDGVSNLAEYLAGTDPQSPASRLSITSESVPAAGQFAVTWPAVAGKLYRLRTSPDLATWTPLTPLQFATATGAQSVTLDTGGALKLFVRVEIAP